MLIYKHVLCLYMYLCCILIWFTRHKNQNSYYKYLNLKDDFKPCTSCFF